MTLVTPEACAKTFYYADFHELNKWDCSSFQEIFLFMPYYGKICGLHKWHQMFFPKFSTGGAAIKLQSVLLTKEQILLPNLTLATPKACSLKHITMLICHVFNKIECFSFSEIFFLMP
jgi:hypothetical protein